MMSVRINLIDNSFNRATCVIENTERCQTMTAVTTIHAGLLIIFYTISHAVVMNLFKLTVYFEISDIENSTVTNIFKL